MKIFTPLFMLFCSCLVTGTHAQVAALAGTSRTRITALINRNTKDISTDLMLRVLGALGVAAKITFGRAA